MPKAFVSYCRSDRAIVDEKIKPVLNALNIDIWIDTENLHGAERWKEAISRSMPECDIFLVLVTTAAAASPSVRAEVEWVLRNSEKKLIPILAEKTRLDGIHPDMPNIQHVDCINESTGRCAAKIARAIIHLGDRQIKALEKRNGQLSEMSENLRIKYENKISEIQDSSETAIQVLNEEVAELKEELKGLQEQLDLVLKQEGDWGQPPLGIVSDFIRRRDRNAPIIAVMNVKGGVGKSTISANLAATWWGREKNPLRVLLIDLDFQGSATALCISPRDREDLREGDLFVNSLFDEKVKASDHLLRSIRRVGRGNGYVLASNDGLLKVETEIMAKWLTLQTKKDIRFLLRELLHGKIVQDRFDLVILDCPPRFHVAGVNALSAADYLLIPVLMDYTSGDSVPRMLKWVRNLIDWKICPSLEILGVIANKKSDRRKELLDREDNLWKELKGNCRVNWGGEVPFCETIIPFSSKFAESSQTPGKFACEDSTLHPVFLSLVQKLENQMNSNSEWEL